MTLLAEKHPNWDKYKEKLLDGAISYYQAEKEMGINRANIHYAVNRPTHVLVDVCQDCGNVHVRKTCPDKPKKPRGAYWRDKPPKCPECEGEVFKVCSLGIECCNNQCGKFIFIETKTVIRYKY